MLYTNILVFSGEHETQEGQRRLLIKIALLPLRRAVPETREKVFPTPRIAMGHQYLSQTISWEAEACAR